MTPITKEFTILGQKVVIQEDAAGAESGIGQEGLAPLALKIVNEKIAAIQSAKPLLGPSQVAVLALLEIAGDLVKDRKAIDGYRTELDKKCSHLMAGITRLREREAGTPNP